MTHRWGFDLSMSAVRLMRREAGHWQEIASTPIGEDDMDQQIRALVEQVPEPRVVDIFLPQDQILYTDVAIDDPDKAVSEIEAAMEGRTPYALSDLEIDWEIGADGTARVAAIAKLTLSEAEAFAVQCGLGVARFSSLPEIDDFPRQPDFGIGAAGDTAAPLDGAPADKDEPAAFVTSREDSPPEDENATAETGEPVDAADTKDDSTPVVQVEDAAPVMQVAEERAAPLDPGPALPRAAGAPRVRTDLSLPDGGGRAAASLTPPEPIDPYGRAEPKTGSRLQGLGLGLAAVLTAGIAVVVWSIVPEGTTQSDATPPPASAETEVAAVAPPPAAALDDTPPNAQAVVTDAPAQPDIPETALVEVAPLNATPERQKAAFLTAPIAQSGTRPDALVPPDTPANTWVAAPAVLASLVTIPDDSGLRFDTPVPPVTRPGNVGLPGAQGFEPGLVPPTEAAPAYVAPPPPVLAEEPDQDLSITEDDATELAAIDPGLTADEDTPLAAVESAPAPSAVTPAEDTELAALDDSVALEPEVDITPLDPAPVEPQADDANELNDDAPVAEAPAPELPRLTEFAASLPDSRAPARPNDFALEIERQKFGGRTVSELAQIRPPERPASAQAVAAAERGNAQPSALAVSTSLDPRGRPDNMGDIIARTIAIQRERRLAALPTANTTDAVRAALGQTVEETPEETATNPRNSPRLAIPSNADVARQATIEDAIRLNRLNLVGVFGAPSDRRALVRLPTGRYVKVKIGDRVDGGTIAAITDDALQYRKGGRLFQLEMPQG